MLSNTGDVPHVFQVATAALGLYYHLNINETRPTSQYRYFIFQWYIDYSRKPIYITHSQSWCDALESHTHLSTSLILFTLTAEHTWPLVSSIDDVFHLWLILVTFQFPAILFLMAKLPTMKTVAVFSVVFVWLLRPNWFAQRWFDRHRLRLRGWRMCHECSGLCSCRRWCKRFPIVQCFKQDCSSFACCHRLPDVV